jgi:AraC family transcriptional regulator
MSLSIPDDRRVTTPQKGRGPGGRLVYRGPNFAFGEFWCPAGDARWSEENWIGDKHHVVFPQTTVGIVQRRTEVVADPNTAILYNAGETYRRRLIDPRGDRCFYAELDEGLVEELMMRGGRRSGFTAVSVPIDARLYAFQWKAVRLLSRQPGDGLALDETFLELLAGLTVGMSFDTGSSHADGRKAVERTKRVIAERLNEPLMLQDIAGLVYVSPFHLTRLFRRHTGMPLHRYRNELRLRAGLSRLAEGDEAVRDVAIELGFGSHSHFTSRFRAAFGFTPQQWRRCEC